MPLVQQLGHAVNKVVFAHDVRNVASAIPIFNMNEMRIDAARAALTRISAGENLTLPGRLIAAMQKTIDRQRRTTMNRKVFFDTVRQKPFGGSLSQAAVDGMNAILDEWDARPDLTDLRWLAYMLATTLGEVGKNMQPVREGFTNTDAESRAYVKRKDYAYAKEINGQVYYGRGLVQLTWETNYRTMGEVLGFDLVHNPDLALRLDIAVKIMFEGMIRGAFTGRKLGDYFAAGTDWFNARRIINALDRAEEIAGYGRDFYSALQASQETIIPATLEARLESVEDRLAAVEAKVARL